MEGFIIAAIIVIVVLIVIVRNIKIVPQAHAYVIERLGAYKATWDTGFHLKVPFIDKIAKKLS
ncbi:MAG: peptidase, partial [Ruminococcus sp.]|nr:peptidase [Ruminococcus sp.]